MKGILGKIFGSDKAISKALDGAYNGVDKLVFTEEEKADRFERLLKLYEPFKLAQRLLAVIFSVPWALGWIIAFVMAAFGQEITELKALLSGQMGSIVLTINAFYFGGGALEGLIKAGKK